jgi:hypothetical protein
MRSRVGVALTVGLAFAAGAFLRAQEPGKTKDDALDSLLEKLAGPGEKPAPKSGKAALEPRSKSTKGKSQTASGDKTGKPARPKAGTIAPKDQAIDDLLEKLGETKDAPTPEERPQNPAGGQSKEPSGSEKAKAGKLGGKDKEIDERLEEYAGRKKKRRASDEQPSGPLGEIIKEMRDVEQRLGKPDSGEDTQNKQKQIVRHIDTLIEQVRQAGSSGGGRLTLRRIRQQGQQQGKQPGDQTGALARGAPPTKPGKPTSQHSTAGGKDVWGHLPPELREVMENSFKEAELASKAEMISRYFLSIGKGKRVREE